MMTFQAKTNALRVNAIKFRHIGLAAVIRIFRVRITEVNQIEKAFKNMLEALVHWNCYFIKFNEWYETWEIISQTMPFIYRRNECYRDIILKVELLRKLKDKAQNRWSLPNTMPESLTIINRWKVWKEYFRFHFLFLQQKFNLFALQKLFFFYFRLIAANTEYRSKTTVVNKELDGRLKEVYVTSKGLVTISIL